MVEQTTTFRPSRHGFAFSNNEMVGQPVRVFGVRIAKVIGGLCGGMCIAARDGWREDTHPTETTCSPSTLLVIQRAQIRSFAMPWAPLDYLRLQRRTAVGARRHSTLGVALPAIRRAIDSGEPALLGLVCALGSGLGLLSRHHVVLAYALDQSNEAATVRIYDPNYPLADNITLQINADGSTVHSRGRQVHAVLPLDQSPA